MKIVCICGSSRFVAIVAVKAWEYEKQGILALSMHLLPSSYTDVSDHLAEAEGVAEILDELHLRKIDMADWIYVVDQDGYIGERTQIEIDYARRAGKPVLFMESCEVRPLPSKVHTNPKNLDIIDPQLFAEKIRVGERIDP